MNEEWNKGALLRIEHSDWANRQIYFMLENEPLDSKPWQLFAHVLAATHHWLARLMHKEVTLPIWPVFTAKQEAFGLLEANHRSLTPLSQSLSLHQSIAYKNSKGEPFEMEVWEIVEHVFLHEHYHRGQINMEAKRQGLVPVGVDMIYYLRMRK